MMSSHPLEARPSSGRVQPSHAMLLNFKGGEHAACQAKIVFFPRSVCANLLHLAGGMAPYRPSTGGIALAGGRASWRDESQIASTRIEGGAVKSRRVCVPVLWNLTTIGSRAGLPSPNAPLLHAYPFPEGSPAKRKGVAG